MSGLLLKMSKISDQNSSFFAIAQMVLFMIQYTTMDRVFIKGG